AATGSTTVEALQMDMGSLKSIHAAVEEFRRRHNRLHVLFNNAAVFSNICKTTADGFESGMGINLLGHFLLTNLLLDTLKASAPARVIGMTMDSSVPINFDDLMLEKKYSGMASLQGSKGAITCFTVE